MIRVLVAFLLALAPSLAWGQSSQPGGLTISPGAAPTDRSGTVTLGGSAQQLMAANTSRRGCWVQNQSSGDLWVYELSAAAATQPSHWLPSGSEWTCPTNGVPVGAISIFGATSTQAFAAREW